MTITMGLLHYGSPPVSFPFDDRTLAHLEMVVLAKLRRNESFALSLDDGSGRSTVWVNASSTLRFQFDDGAKPDINRAWLDLLIEGANTAPGLRVVPEPAA